MMTSHDHTFLQTVANRVIEITPTGAIDRLCSFDEYLADERVKQLRETMYSHSVKLSKCLINWLPLSYIIPASTRIGHVHLKVADIPAS